MEEAAALARICALNALAAAAGAAGGLDAITRIVKVTCFVASDPSFTGQAQVANGASEFLIEVLGEAGRHARSAVGMAVLPLDTPVEVELIAEVGGVRIQLNSASGFGDRLAQRVADMVAGRTVPAAPRNAATVMLLRPCAARTVSRC